MTFPSLTRSKIQEQTSGGSFERGQQYLADGAVRSLKQTGERTLKGQVQGSDVHPYIVTIHFSADKITDAKCTCPYYEGSWCKHIVAVLLKTLEGDPIPGTAAITTHELVADLDRTALVALIERLAEHDPDLIDQIERECARLQSEN